MFTLAHLSDVHLAPLPTPWPHQLLSKRLIGFLNWHMLGRKRHYLRDTLDRLVAHMKTQAFDHIALTGDIANIALPQEFAASQAWLTELGTGEEVSIVPGNHDAYTVVSMPKGIMTWAPHMCSNEAGRKYASSLHEDPHDGFPYVRVIGEVAIIGVTSGVPTKPFLATGELGPRQRDALAATLQNLDGTDLCRVLLIHHPPLPTLAANYRNLTDDEELGDVLRADRVDLVLHGHNHTSTTAWGQGPDHLFPVIGVAAASMGHAGAKPLARYNLYDLDRGASDWDVRVRGYGFKEPDGGVVQLEDTHLIAPTDFTGET